MSRVVLARTVAGFVLLVAVGVGVLAPARDAAVADELKPQAIVGSSLQLRTSSGWLAMLGSRPTVASGSFLLPASCGTLTDVTVGLISASGTRSPIEKLPGVGGVPLATVPMAMSLGSSDFLGTCVVNVNLTSSPSDPAQGRLLLARANLPIGSFEYKITRVSTVSVYLAALIAAMVLSLFTVAIGSWSLPRESELEPDYKYTEGWASTLTAVVAAAATLLSATGVLNEFLPQYSTAGIVAANVLVAVLLALGPALFLILRDDEEKPTRRGLLIAAFATLTGVYGQLSLVVLILLVIGLPSPSAVLIAVGATIAVCGVCIYVAKTLGSAAKDKPGKIKVFL